MLITLLDKSVRGAAFIIAGAMCLVLSLTIRQRRSYPAAAVALVPFGIALPLCTDREVALVGGMAVMVAAGILAGQLRGEWSVRERAAH